MDYITADACVTVLFYVSYIYWQVLYFIACSNSESSLLSQVINLHCTHTCRFGSHIYFQFSPFQFLPVYLMSIPILYNEGAEIKVDSHFFSPLSPFWCSGQKMIPHRHSNPRKLLVVFIEGPGQPEALLSGTILCFMWKAQTIQTTCSFREANPNESCDPLNSVYSICTVKKQKQID